LKTIVKKKQNYSFNQLFNSFTIIFAIKLTYLTFKTIVMEKFYQISVLVFFLTLNSFGQVDKDKEYTNIDEALKNPESVYKLDLSNQEISLKNEQWKLFINLEYLNLKNDRLKEIPKEISNLKQLKVLNLSGNDFNSLPNEFSNLNNLEELFLNDEKNINLPKTLKILSKLPKLKSLHLENDNLYKLPNEINDLKSLESLYLNNNHFETIPNLKPLDHLKYLDLRENHIKPELLDQRNLNFGFKIIF
jgi:Leucine-rich repeat (LRR) protein